ncbi:MAG TPA: CFI-box-CTERM domain-containing protein [Thermoanaerobaculia bacterium]|nr:CFI-box-CTERM domain-containing protein [Thermoanaerobaculia bacterium]
MHCESCESDVAEPRMVPRTTLSAAVEKGFGPWGNTPPSMEWPRYVRALWWKGSAADDPQPTLCASCDALLASFTPLPYEHEWLTGLRASIAASRLRTPEMPPIGGSSEIDALAHQIARDLAAVPAGEGASLKSGFAKHGEKYGLAAATILLTGEIKSETLSFRSRAAELLATWDDARATAVLVRAVQNPLYVTFVAPNIIRRSDPNALPELVELLSTYLRLDDRCAAVGEPPFKTPFLIDLEPIKARHPDLEPIDLMRISQASVSIGHLLRAITTLGEREWGLDAAREIHAHSLFHDDVMYASGALLQLADSADQEAVALAVAGQGFEIGIGDSFEQGIELLVRQQASAGWWAMDRFCRTAEHWHERAGMVRSKMAKIPRPSEEALRRYERRYGRFLDFKRTGKVSPPSSGCFIATAAYGSADHAEVARLRTFRDDVLRRTNAGRAAIGVYERVSPPIARVVARSAASRAVVRLLIRASMFGRPMIPASRSNMQVDPVLDQILLKSLSPALREEYESRLRLWRRGIAM